MGLKHSQKSEDEGTQGTQGHDCPTRLDDLLVGDSATKIPHQVTNTVHTVVNEGESHETLKADLGEERESTESGRHRSGLEVPAQHRRDEICGREKVQATGQQDTSDTVDATANPGNLGTVDGKVGGDRTVPTLLGEDLSWVRGVGSRGRSPIDPLVRLIPKLLGISRAFVVVRIGNPLLMTSKSQYGSVATGRGPGKTADKNHTHNQLT